MTARTDLSIAFIIHHLSPTQTNPPEAETPRSDATFTKKTDNKIKKKKEEKTKAGHGWSHLHQRRTLNKGSSGSVAHIQPRLLYSDNRVKDPDGEGRTDNT